MLPSFHFSHVLFIVHAHSRNKEQCSVPGALCMRRYRCSPCTFLGCLLSCTDMSIVSWCVSFIHGISLSVHQLWREWRTQFLLWKICVKSSNLSWCCNIMTWHMQRIYIEFEQARIALFLLESRTNCSSVLKCKVTYNIIMRLCSLPYCVNRSWQLPIYVQLTLGTFKLPCWRTRPSSTMHSPFCKQYTSSWFNMHYPFQRP